MDMVCWRWFQVIFMKENGNKEERMEKDYIDLQIMIFMMAILLMDWDKDMEDTNGMTILIMKVIEIMKLLR